LNGRSRRRTIPAGGNRTDRFDSFGRLGGFEVSRSLGGFDAPDSDCRFDDASSSGEMGSLSAFFSP